MPEQHFYLCQNNLNMSQNGNTLFFLNSIKLHRVIFFFLRDNRKATLTSGFQYIICLHKLPQFLHRTLNKLRKVSTV
jgi:hypothetical protein